MALDMKRLRSKLDRMQGKSAFWKPKGGRNEIRIVPWKDRPEWPFIEMLFHYNLGNKNYLSPLTHGNPDPVQEFADNLRADGTNESYELAKPFMAKLRTFVPVIVRMEGGNEVDPSEQGVRFYSFGKTVYEKLLEYIDDPDYGDITDVEKGFDVVLNYTTRENSDTPFPKTEVRMRREPSPLSEDENQIEQWLKEQPDIFEIYEEPSYDDLMQVLDRVVGNESDDDQMTSLTEQMTNSDESDDDTSDDGGDDSVSETSDSVKDVKNQFDALFAGS